MTSWKFNKQNLGVSHPTKVVGSNKRRTSLGDTLIKIKLKVKREKNMAARTNSTIQTRKQEKSGHERNQVLMPTKNVERKKCKEGE